MTRTVYVVTTARRPWARVVRHTAWLILARLVITLAWIGHAIAQAAGAADAVLAALLGIPRLAVIVGRVRSALYATWGA